MNKRIILMILMIVMISVFISTSIGAQGISGKLTQKSDTVEEYRETFKPTIIDEKTMEVRVPFLIPLEFKNKEWYNINRKWKFYHSIAVCDEKKGKKDENIALSCSLRSDIFEASLVRRDSQYLYYQYKIPRWARNKLFWPRHWGKMKKDRKKYYLVIDDLSELCRNSDPSSEISRYPNKPGYEYLVDTKGKYFPEKIVAVPDSFERRP